MDRPSQEEFDNMPVSERHLYETIDDYHRWLQSVSDWETGYFGTDEDYVKVSDFQID